METPKTPSSNDDRVPRVERRCYAAELVLDELLEPDEELDDEDEPDDEELEELDDESEEDDVEEDAVDGFDAGALLDDEPRLSLR